jgi:hypothetical protein
MLYDIVGVNLASHPAFCLIVLPDSNESQICIYFRIRLTEVKYTFYSTHSITSICRTTPQKPLHTIHSLPRKGPHLILFPIPFRPPIKNLHREPSPKPRPQHSPRNILNRQIPSIIRHRPIIMTPPPPSPQPTNRPALQRRLNLIRIRDLQQVDFIRGHSARKLIHARVKSFPQVALRNIFNEAGGGRRIPPFAAGSLERVKA